MKFLLIVVALATIYFILSKRNLNQPQPATSAAATHQVKPAATPNEPTKPGTNYFKRPLDRTHEVLDQAKKNNSSNDF